jgi:RNA polymerase sigma factor (sigma-70 family)
VGERGTGPDPFGLRCGVGEEDAGSGGFVRLGLEESPERGKPLHTLAGDPLMRPMGSLAAETATAEAQLYERHSEVVYRYCLRMLRTREDAEDATQTTFFQALRAMRRGVVPTFEQAWLLTIARNECRSRHRAGSRRRRLELAHDPQALSELAEAPNGDDGRLVGVQEALAQLPEAQRRALLLREWQGKRYDEIAQDLGISRPAVEALIFRARRGLARALSGERTTRRHALDVAALLGAFKSALGGGAALKVAVGIAAVATVGTVASETPQDRPQAPPAAAAVAERSLPASARAPAVAAKPRTAPRRGIGPRRVKSRKRAATTTAASTAKRAPATPTAPTAPRAGEQAPEQPVAAPPASPAAPPVAGPPSPPAPTPSPPALPIPQAPQLPAAPALPEVPQAPALPELPVVSDLVDVPEIPGVPLPLP